MNEMGRLFSMETRSWVDENSQSESVEKKEDSKETFCSSQTLAENVHRETKASYIEKYGSNMSTERIQGLESEETGRTLEVLSSEQYTERFPEVDLNVIGHCDGEGNIYVKDISPEIVNHTITHETTHLCADREYFENEDGEYQIVRGVREIWGDENGVTADFNLAINEGLTEMYAKREMMKRNDIEAVNAIDAYSEACMWAERMESLVGNSEVSAAYFGADKETMIKEFNRLNGGNEDAWLEFTMDLDTITYSQDEQEIELAREHLADQYLTMYVIKYELNGEDY